VGTGETAKAAQICSFISDIPGVKLEKVDMKRLDANEDLTLIEEGWVLKSARWFALPKEEKSKLFVRQCYEKLLEKVMTAWSTPNGYHVLLIGTPGTSKTFFVNYVAYKLLSKPRDFHVIICHNSRFVSVDPGNSIEIGWSLMDFDDLVNRKGTVILYDCSNTNSDPPYMANAKVLAASSPNKNQYKDFTKYFCTTLCMPLWSLDELELCRQTCFDSGQVQGQSNQTTLAEESESPLYPVSAQELESRYNLWGGVIRWTIGAQCRESESDFQKALAGIDFGIALQAVGCWNQMDFKSGDVTHRLIHADTQDMVTFQCKFCSQAACESTIQRLAVQADQECRQFLASTSAQPVFASLRGQVFEAYAHRILEKEGSISVRFLDGNGTARESIDIGPRSLKVFENLEDIGKQDYAIPKAKNFAAVDSVAAPYLAFSMTVSSHHPTVASGLLRILPVIDQGRILVFVVPREIEADFKKQNYLTLAKTTMQRVPEKIQKIRQAVMAIDL
jgi:hypothetical protein